MLKYIDQLVKFLETHTVIAWILLACMILFIFGYLIASIVCVIKNEKYFKKFRTNLKVGDETNEGVVIAIKGFNVITEKTTRIERVYPQVFPHQI